MAGSVLPLDKFIKNSYGIQVAARYSSDVEEICKKNCLTFCELLRPFSQLVSESRLQDPQGHFYTIRDLRIKFSEPSTDSPSPERMDQLLNDSVHWSETNLLDSSSKEPLMSIQNVEAPVCAPWFSHYCETFLDNVSVMEHEHIRHFVAVVLVVSSRLHHPVESIQKLYKIQKESEQYAHQQPYWIPSPHIFYYHVLIHDVLDGDHKHARECYDLLKGTYGIGNCYFLAVNSLDATSNLDAGVPEPWSACLRITDNQESVDFSFPKFKRKKGVAQSPNVSLKSNNSPSTIHQPKCEEMREEPKLESVKDEEEGPQHSSSSSVSVVSSQIELGADPLSESDICNDVHEDITIRRIGGCMSLEDQNSLRTFVKEFSNRLLSHLEAVLKKTNDSLQSRRTVSRRMSSFSRGFIWKMMGGSTTGTPTTGTTGSGSTTNNGDNQNLSVDSIERQMRLVGDLAFLLQNYELAYNMHHTLKRDLQGRELWLHFAGAHEMAALSAQMMGSSRKEIQSYLEEATTIYNTQLQLPHFGLRVSIFLCEILKSRGKYRNLVSCLGKLITDESDLRNALLLEQSAHAFLKHEPVGMIRKFALHMVLSANHYSKADQKVHAVRAYKLALQLYANNGWNIAESFLQYIMAKLCFTLERPHQTLESLETILSIENKQPVQQQLSSLMDYIHIRKVSLAELNMEQITISSPWSTNTNEDILRNTPYLPIPIIQLQAITVVFDNGVLEPGKWLTLTKPPSVTNGTPLPDIQLHTKLSSSSSSSRSNRLFGGIVIGVLPYDPEQWTVTETEWSKLEKACYLKNKDGKCCVVLMEDGKDNSDIPLCPLKEPIRVEVPFINPLAIKVQLKYVSLTWTFETDTSQNDNESCVYCEVIESLELPPNSQQKVSFWVIPTQLGLLSIKGVVFNLCASNEDVSDDDNYGETMKEGFQGKLRIHCNGLRLNTTKADKVGVVYGQDNRLCWKIIDPLPRAMMIIQGLHDHHMAGELVLLTIKLVNCSTIPLDCVSFSSTLYCNTLLSDHKVSNSDECNYYPMKTSMSPSCNSLSLPLPSLSKCIQLPLPSGSLLPGEYRDYCLYLHIPPHYTNVSQLPWNIVMQYQPLSNTDCLVSHRVSRHCEVLSVCQYLQFKASLISSLSLHDNSRDIYDSLLLSVNIDNNQSGIPGGPSHITVHQISTVSRYWSITKTTNECNGIIAGGSSVIHLIMSKTDKPSSTDILFSDMCLSERTDVIPSNEFLISNLFFSSTINKSLTIQQLLNDSMVIIIFWKASYDGDITKYGHHYVTVPIPKEVELQPEVSPLHITPTNSLSQYDLIKHTLFYDSCVIHDFMKMRICVVPIQILLENSSVQQVNVSLEMLLSAEATIGTRSLEPCFHWSGPVKRFFTLPPLCRHSEQLYANFSRMGVYNLNALRIKACYSSTGHSNDTMYNQRWQTSTYITVKTPD